MTTHVPIVKSAAKHRLQRVKRTTFSMEGEVATYYEVGSRRESAQCLQELVMSLIHILNKLIHNTHGGQPSTDFRASHLPGDNRQWDRPAFEFTINRTRMRKEVLLRRCHDLIFVCTVNLYSLEFRSGVPLSFFSRLWPLVQKVCFYVCVD